MNVLITGSSGYIGRNLTEHLSSKYNLYTPPHRELDLLNETLVLKYFKNHKIDIVINTAVVGGSRTEEYARNMFYDNLRMFFNITRCKNHFKKMIHLGSGAEYDKRFPIKKVKEEDFGKRVPADDYGYYKYLCSKYIENTAGIVNLRIFGLFGEYEDYKYRSISNAICRNIFRLPITLNQDVYFDYVYIGDFIRIIKYFITNEVSYKSYNIGTGKPIKLKRIADKINKIANQPSSIIIKNKGLGREYTCDNTRLIKELGDFKFTNFDVTLKNLYNWYKQNKKKIDKKSL